MSTQRHNSTWGQKSIVLSSLLSHDPVECSFSGLASAVQAAAREQS